MPFFPPGATGAAAGTQTPAANSVPQSLSAGYLATGWMPPSVNANIRYCSPYGSDANPGDSWQRPLQYLKTAWTQLYSLGGGTIHFADQTAVAANGKGLHVASGVNQDPNAVLPMPVRVIGTAPPITAAFDNIPRSRLYGGSPRSGVEQDDPGIWISSSVGNPMSFENIQLQDELNKSWRVAWDYYRDNAGAIVKTAVTAASRAAGVTVFTCTPITFQIQKISVTSEVATIIVDTVDFQQMPIRPGAVIDISYAAHGFSAGVYTRIDTAAVDGNRIGFQVAAPGVSNFTDGTVGGSSLGTAKSNLGTPSDTMTLYGGVTEFPASTYLINSVTSTTITCTDYYGYSPRSATASTSSAVGTYAIQDRFSFNVARIALFNYGSRLIRDDSVETFVNGPGFDCGPLEFFDFKKCGVLGNNLATVGGEYGCRDPRRRCSTLFDTGSAGAGIGFGYVEDAPIAYGGFYYNCSVNSSATISIKKVCLDEPLIGFKGCPAVEVAQVTKPFLICLDEISLVDVVDATPAIKVNVNAPYGAVQVGSVFGLVDGPALMVGGAPPAQADDRPITPNTAGQTGYWGADRLIAGRHPGTYRNGNIASAPLPGAGIVAAAHGSWTNQGGATYATGKRNPFGEMTAISVAGGGSQRTVIPFYGHVGGNSAAGDIYIAAMWVRGNAKDNNAFTLIVENPADNTVKYLNKSAPMPTLNGGDWNCIAVGGRLTGSPVTNASINFQFSIGASDTLEVFEPTIYFCTAADHAFFSSISDAELGEIITNAKTIPAYLPDGAIGSHADQKVIAHGGIGTNSANAKTVGVGSGQLTLTGTGTVYLPMYDADGTTIIGWVAQLQATVNP